MALNDSNTVGRWKLTSGALLVDDGGAGNNLTLTDNGTVGHVNGHAGGTNKAAGFNASTKRLSRADEAALDITGSLTIAAWVKCASQTTGAIVSKFGASGQFAFILQAVYVVDDGLYLRITLSNDGAAQQYTTSTTPIATGAWKHVAVVYNQTDVRLYINGSLANTPLSRTTAIANSTAEFQIGHASGYNANQWFKGDIDDVYLSSRALSASEIAELYALGDDFPAAGAVLAGSAQASATASGNLSTGIPLAGNAAASATASGNLSTGIPLAGDAAAQATASGALAGSPVELAGNAAAQATASGTLDGRILYWVNGTGLMHDPAHWSASDGGPGGEPIPDIYTDIRFTPNSSAGSYTVTHDGSLTGRLGIRNWTTEAPASGTLTICNKDHGIWDVRGSVSFHAGMSPTITGTGAHLDLAFANEPTTLRTNGANLPWLVVCGSNIYGPTPNAAVTLLDNLLATAGEGALVMRNGLFDANGFDVTVSAVYCNNRVYYDINEEPIGWEYGEVRLGTGTWTMTNGGWSYLAPSLMTITLPANPLDSVVRLTNNLATDVAFGSTVAGFSKTFGVLEVASTGAGATIINGNHAFADLRITGTARTVKVQAGKTITFAEFNGSGSAGSLNALAPATAGQAYNFAKSGSSGLVSNDYLSIAYCAASPANIWFAGSHSTDGGNNTGWSFTDPLMGSAQASATASGSLSTGIPLSGDAAAQAAASGGLTTGITLTGASIAAAGAGGELSAQINLAGASIALVTAGGQLTAQITLAGDALAQAAASAGLDTSILLAGAAAGQATASGSLGGGAALAGDAQAQAQASAVLTAQITLSGQAAALVGASGTLTAQIVLSGAALAQALAGGSLSVWLPSVPVRMATAVVKAAGTVAGVARAANFAAAVLRL